MLHGRTVNFKNAVIIMTSNVGARAITDVKTLGFTNHKDQEDATKKYEETKKEVLTELKKQFKPEFINRIDEIIVFHQLSEEEIKQIIDIMLKEVEKRLEDNNIQVKMDPSVKELIAKKGVDKAYGARPLRRSIQSIIEDKLAEEILEGTLKSGDKAKVSAKAEEILVKVSK